MNRFALFCLLPVFWLISFVSVPRYLWAIVTNPDRARRLAISYDQLANTILNGDQDETISSRAGKAQIEGRTWGCVLCQHLDKLDPRHCQKSIEYDEGRKIRKRPD